MIVSKPDYYDEFTCIADRCEETCCAGWQIVIDEKALEAYKKVEGDFGQILKASIDWEEGVFYQDENRRCAFLNNNNLCDLYTELGEESLCKTCTNYPRHIEEFENIREYTLSVSCPEVARILLSKKETVEFMEEEVDGEEEFEDFDFLLFSQLEDGRAVMEQILQNRNLPISLRAYLVWELGQKIQNYMDEENLFAVDEVFEEFEKEDTWLVYEKNLQEIIADKSNIYEITKEYFSKLFELEFLKEDWHVQLLETESILFGQGEKAFSKLQGDFYTWLRENMSDYEIWMEQLMVYFIHTYFCGAVYNYYILSKAKLSVVSVWMIVLMLAAKWYRNDGYLDMEEVIMTVYRYSRELEHSDQNLETMDEILDEEAFL